MKDKERLRICPRLKDMKETNNTTKGNAIQLQKQYKLKEMIFQLEPGLEGLPLRTLFG